MEAIRVQNLVHDYRDLHALKGISFGVDQGEIFSLLGPNGAGKTTTIRILTGQLKPVSGQVWVSGIDMIKEPQKAKPLIGVVFEYPNLYERMSARENLLFVARLYGVSKKRVNMVLELAGLSERSGEKVKNYSNGMKQRLLIARALLHDPQILFLDEPTRGLDAHIAREIRKLISELAEQGVTILLTTHYIEEADRLSNRVAFLDQGKIVALDTPAQIKSDFSTSKRVTLEDVFVHLTGKDLHS